VELGIYTCLRRGGRGGGGIGEVELVELHRKVIEKKKKKTVQKIKFAPIFTQSLGAECDREG
jgi:hypothetical protein